MSKLPFNYIDFFSGIAGFSLSAKQAGIEFKNHFYSDIERYTCQIYQARFPEAHALGDITKIDGYKLKEEYGDQWIFSGGSPCQDISTAGKQKGLINEETGEITRSGLWFEYVRLVNELKPKFVFAENVGALISNGMNTFISTLVDVGYELQWRDIRASDVGLPHKRERIWICAYPKGSINEYTIGFGVKPGQKPFGQSIGGKIMEVDSMFPNEITKLCKCGMVVDNLVYEINGMRDESKDNNLLGQVFNGDYFPTPMLQDSRISNNNIGGHAHRMERGSVALSDVVMKWPTPIVDSASQRTTKYTQGGMPLSLAVSNAEKKDPNWQTPTAQDGKGHSNFTEWERQNRGEYILSHQVKGTEERNEEKFPTPTKSDPEASLEDWVDRSVNKKKTKKKGDCRIQQTLGTFIQMKEKFPNATKIEIERMLSNEKWATPVANEPGRNIENATINENGRLIDNKGNDHGLGLAQQVKSEDKKWATPSVMDHRTDVRDPADRSDAANKGGCSNLREQVVLKDNEMWLTPTVVNAVRSEEGKQKKQAYRNSIGRNTVPPGSLGEQVAMDNPSMDLRNDGEIKKDNYPTPRARDWKGPGGRGDLPQVIDDMAKEKKWPTPVKSDERQRRETENWSGSDLVSTVTKQEESEGKPQPRSGGNLNPDWVCLLMDFPLGWTDIDDQWKIYEKTNDQIMHLLNDKSLSKGMPDYMRNYCIRVMEGKPTIPAGPSQPQYQYEPPRLTTIKKNRNSRLKSLGNSIVVKCAMLIWKSFIPYLLQQADSIKNEKN